MSTAAFVVSALLSLWAVRAAWYWRLPHRTALDAFMWHRWPPEKRLLRHRAVSRAYGRLAVALAVYAAAFSLFGWLLR